MNRGQRTGTRDQQTVNRKESVFWILCFVIWYEVRVQIDYLKDLRYITEEQKEEIEREYIEIGKMLVAMIKKWK